MAEAYEAVQSLLAETAASDAEITARERRTRFTKILTSTVRSIESLDPDDLVAVEDDDLRAGITAAQKWINKLADLISPSAPGTTPNSSR